MKGVEARTPDSLLLVRARDALAQGALDSATLLERVCAMPGAPARVADRLAEALFARHTDFTRDEQGRWTLAPDRNGVRPLAAPESVPAADQRRMAGAPTAPTVRERRQGASGGYEADDVSLRDVSFAVVDVETTGTSPAQRDRVTEIAIVQVVGGEVGDCYETLVNPERSIPPAIVALTRITEEMVREAPRFREVAHDVVGRLRARVFVAHNVSFDWRFVSHEVQRAAGVTLTGEQLCTVRLARHLLPQLPRRSLDAVTQYFGIDIGARHRAAGDALATAHVLVRLLRLAEDRGATTWRELEALLQRGRSRAARRRSAMPRGVDLDPTI